MKKLFGYLLSFFLPLAPGLIYACDDVGFAEHFTVQKSKLIRNGQGKRTATMFNVEVYRGALYLEKKSNDADAIVQSKQIKRVDMKFVREIASESMQEGWDDSFKKLCKECKNIKNEMKQLNSLMPTLKEGQKLAFNFLPTEVQVFYQEKKIGTIKGAEFSKKLLSTWLGPYPPTEDLKKCMLGKK